MNTAEVRRWVKSSRTAGNGQCVEVAFTPAEILTRDSKDPSGPVLSLSPKDWIGFLTTLHPNA